MRQVGYIDWLVTFRLGSKWNWWERLSFSE